MERRLHGVKRFANKRPPAVPAARLHGTGPSTPPRSGHGPWFWVIAAAFAVAWRVSLILLRGGALYPGDHDDFARWGIQATDRGVLTLYSEAPARHNWRGWNGQQWVIGQRQFDRICNYPPLAAYLVSLSGLVFRAVSPDRLINTATSLLVFSSWSIAGDILLAAGCAAIVALFRGRWAVRLTYLLALFLPPFWWDSVVWTQMDAVLLAPAVWMLYFVLRQRWLLAGVLWGLAFSLKPQAILFVPLWGYALFATRPFWQPLLGGLVAGATLLVTALPFMLHSGWAWFDLSYYQNLFSTYTNFTTLKAFDIWYLDLLISDSLDAKATWLGLTKSLWGKIFLLLGLLSGFVFALWRWRRDRRGLILWATVSVLLFVMLPTEVHERYIVLVLPFLGVLAALTWRAAPALLALTVVAMLQMTWPLWLDTKPGTWTDIKGIVTQRYNQARAENRAPVQVTLEETLAANRSAYLRGRSQTAPFEWLLTILALSSTVSVVALFVRMRPQTAPPRSPRAS